MMTAKERSEVAYLPKFQKQLGVGTPVPGATKGSRDCGPRTIQMGIDKQTRGRRVPTIDAIRKKMGTPGPQQTNIYDAKQGVEAFPAVKGHKPLRYYIKSRTADVKEAVKRGKYVQCCIHYGVWNRLMKATGDPNFTGGHSVGVYGQRTRNDVVQWLLWDPLDDKRRRGIPQGPRWVPREKVIRAMEAFAGGKGRCYAGVFGGGEKR